MRERQKVKGPCPSLMRKVNGFLLRQLWLKNSVYNIQVVNSYLWPLNMPGVVFLAN